MKDEIRNLFYIIDGVEGVIKIPVYAEYKRHFYERREKEPPTFFKLITNVSQREYLDELIRKIMETSTIEGNDARIAISMVQAIPYGESPRFQGYGMRYPYEVIFDNCGICCEKSALLALLLKEMGYGVALFDYRDIHDKHTALGVSCPIEYSYRGSGYAFIESTGRSIVTDTELLYQKCTCWGISKEKLKSTPEVIEVSDGRNFDCYREFFDGKDWNKYSSLLKLDGFDYFSSALIRRLMLKYGL